MIALVSCVAQKLECAAPAKDLYISAWFKKARIYVEGEFDEWYILSAKHYILHPDTVIEPYDEILKNSKEWADVVNGILDKNKWYTIFAGKKYRKYLNHNLIIPLEGMGIGKQLQWLNRNTRYIKPC